MSASSASSVSSVTETMGPAEYARTVQEATEKLKNIECILNNIINPAVTNMSRIFAIHQRCLQTATQQQLPLDSMTWKKIRIFKRQFNQIAREKSDYCGEAAIMTVEYWQLMRKIQDTEVVRERLRAATQFAFNLPVYCEF
jgi:hypothetical protein